jgi:hypothetical protein
VNIELAVVIVVFGPIILIRFLRSLVINFANFCKGSFQARASKRRLGGVRGDWRRGMSVRRYDIMPKPSLPKIVPHLWYTKEAEEAARFYAAVFPDSHVDRVTSLSADSAIGPAGSVVIYDKFSRKPVFQPSKVQKPTVRAGFRGSLAYVFAARRTLGLLTARRSAAAARTSQRPGLARAHGGDEGAGKLFTARGPVTAGRTGSSAR